MVATLESRRLQIRRIRYLLQCNAFVRLSKGVLFFLFQAFL
jgi:hypothetical protein